MLSLVAAGPSGPTSVTCVRLTPLGQQLTGAAAGLNSLLARAIVGLVLFGRQGAKTLPMPAVGLLARAVARRALIGQQEKKAPPVKSAAGILNSLSARIAARSVPIGRQQAKGSPAQPAPIGWQ